MKFLKMKNVYIIVTTNVPKDITLVINTVAKKIIIGIFKIKNVNLLQTVIV